MLSIKAMPILLKIISKIDVTPVIERLKGADIFEEANATEGAELQISKEKVGQLGVEIITDFIPQLGKVADDIPELVAAYKDVSIEEAMKLDAIEVISEIINDEGIRNFFNFALQKKVGQNH